MNQGVKASMCKNLRPFNLERAKAGDPIQTVSGDPAVFIAHVPEASETQRLVYRVGQVINARREDGCGFFGDPHLVMAPVKKQAWMNLYRGHDRLAAGLYETEADADRNCAPDRLGGKARLIEWEE